MTELERMRATALGRVQISSEIRMQATDQLVNAIRAAFTAGASIDELAIESGLSTTMVRAVIRGTGRSRLMGSVAA